MSDIDLNPKTDREVLLLVAQSCNGINDRLDKINGSLLKHEERIDKLESTEPQQGGDTKKQTALSAGIAALISGIGALITYFKG